MIEIRDGDNMKGAIDGIQFYIKTHKDFKNIFSDKENKDPYLNARSFFEELNKYLELAKISEEKMMELKSYIYNKYIIKDVPASYIYYEKNYMKTLGYKYEGERMVWNIDFSKVTFPDDKKNNVLRLIQKDQIDSINVWIDFLLYSQYPIWFKYYVFKEIVKIGDYMPMLEKFTKRSNSTTEKFMEINEEIIDKMYEVIQNYILGNEISYDITSFKNLYNSINKENHHLKK